MTKKSNVLAESKYLEESHEFKKYWDLHDYKKLTKENVNELINLYKKYKDPRNKCTAAIFLSHVDNDDRIPPILFDALKYWDNSGYAGWVVTTNARLFNYYPLCRKKFLDLAFNGKFFERNILINSLFFFQEPLRGMTAKKLNAIIKKFLKLEKNKRLRKIVDFKLNIHKNLKIAGNVLKKYDPLELIKNGADKNIYEPVISGFFGFLKKRKRAIELIRADFKSEFKKIPSNEKIDKILDEIKEKCNL